MSKIRLAAFADEASSVFDEQIVAMKENGIEMLEMRGVDNVNVSKLTVDQAKEAKKKLDDNGLKVWSIGSPIGKIKITDDFAPELDLFKHVLEIADVTDAKCIRMFSFYETNGEEKYRDEVFERLYKYAEAAKGTGIVLCHENEKGIYGDIPERCLEIHKAVPEIKSVFDPANFVQCNVDILKAWDALEPYVYYGHIKDADADGNIVPPGMGIGKIKEYLPKFVAKGCNVLTLEPHLAEFAGLSDLEEEGDKSKVGGMNFANNREAFDFAAKSLKSIIAEI